MINVPLLPVIAQGMTMALAGFVFGLIYFAALERTVILFASGRGWLGPLGLTLGRAAAAVIFLGLAAKLGALSLLAAFVGFLLARVAALRVTRGTR
jgi:hypothetical protein